MIKPLGIVQLALAFGVASAQVGAQEFLIPAGSEPPAPVSVQAAYTLDADGRAGTIIVTALVRQGYHIYAMAQPKPLIATRIHLDPSSGIRLDGGFKPLQAARMINDETLGLQLHKQQGRVRWSTRFTVPADIDPREVRITGHVFAQACSQNGCLIPTKYPFTAQFHSQSAATWKSEFGSIENIGDAHRPSMVVSASPHLRQLENDVAPAPASGTKIDRTEPSNLATTPLDFSKLEVQGKTAAGLPLYVVLATALAAGLILNFMPCVLPVIGLKIMSFAAQAGDHRGRIFMLNLWYALGIVSVFLVLASLAVFLGLGWGQQFSSLAFNIALVSAVFVFALSFLGVWEIPIPGFVGSGGAGELAHKEGLIGAFSKGVLTTVLATPCSGPLLGTALTWAVIQPPLLTYLVFAFVGLGMASPYLLIGAFPGFIAILPKPGAWMNTFKQTMGFVLLATVVYLLTFLPISFVVPTVAFMIGLWAACWWIGRLPLTQELDKKASVWIQAVAVAFAVGFAAFGWLHRVMEGRFQQAVDREIAQRRFLVSPQATNGEATAGQRKGTTDWHVRTELPWQPYSHQLLQQLTAEGKTVFVDFTADWCLTCKANEAVALNTAETIQWVRANGIVTLKADKTRPAPQADELLKLLGNRAGSIPFYAIFPAGNPNHPILLDGLFTSPQPILNALERAGPSAKVARQADTPLRR